MINNVTLIGRLTKDIVLKHSSSGKAFVNFIVAINRYDEKTDFIKCVVFDKRAENAAKYLKKGSLVGVIGRIATDSYEKDGERVFTTSVVVTTLQYLEIKNNNHTDHKEEDFFDKDVNEPEEEVDFDKDVNEPQSETTIDASDNDEQKAKATKNGDDDDFPF